MSEPRKPKEDELNDATAPLPVGPAGRRVIDRAAVASGEAPTGAIDDQTVAQPVRPTSVLETTGSLSADPSGAPPIDPQRAAVTSADSGATVTADPAGADPAVTANPVVADSDSPFRGGALLHGRYKMLRQLGKGGMGSVHLVEDVLLRRRVALKTLFTEGSASREELERFRKEAAIAHTVHHPNVSRIYDIGEARGVHYISMEHLDGETLMDRIRRGPPLTSAEVRRLAIPLCRGLRAAHRAGIIHRDLKPANIMLLADERQVAVMDFGIARTLSDAGDRLEDFDLTQQPTTPWDVTSAGRGTPAYMAPEQWDGASGDERTDVYALGVILYVSLTAQAPFRARSADALAELHRNAPVPDPRAVAKDTDADLADLICRCLAKAPDERPQTMDEVLDRLQWRSRRRQYALSLAGTAALTALVLVLAGLGTWQFTASAVTREVRPALARLATLVARDLAIEDLDAVHDEDDIGTPAFERTYATLLAYKRANPEIRFAYTMRRTAARGLFQFVVDEDWKEEDKDGDGVIGPDEESVPPGEPYDGRDLPAMSAVFDTGMPAVDESFNVDLWGITISGYAPVMRDGKASDVFVGVDAGNEQLETLKRRLFFVLSAIWLLAVAFAAVWSHPALRGRRQKRLAGVL